MNTKHKNRLLSRGFTVVELLIAIGIIALILGVVVASVSSSKDKAADVEVKQTLSEVMLKAEGQEIAPGVVDYQSAFTAVGGQDVVNALAAKFGLAPDQYDYSVAQDGYAIVFPLKNGKYYCIDSTNTTTEVTGLLNIDGPRTCANATRTYVSAAMVGSGVSSVFATTGSHPIGIAVDVSGNIYTTNYSDNNVTKITPDGVSNIFASTGLNPWDIALDSSGNIFTVNFNYPDMITKITPSGTSSTFASGGAGKTFAIDSQNNVYKLNSSSSSFINKITPDGVVSSIATATNPAGIAIDSSDNVYISTSIDHNVTKITSAGVSTVIGTTTNYPKAIVVDSAGNVYLGGVDINNGSGPNTIVKITPSGVSSTFATIDSQIYDMVIDSSGNIYTANYYQLPGGKGTPVPPTGSDNTVTKITPGGTKSTFGVTGSGPRAIAIDDSGNIYTANYNDNTVTKIAP